MACSVIFIYFVTASHADTVMTPLVWLLREILPQLLDTLLSLMPCHGCRRIVRDTNHSCTPCITSHALGEIPGVGLRLFNTKRLDALFSLWLVCVGKRQIVFIVIIKDAVMSTHILNRL